MINIKELKAQKYSKDKKIALLAGGNTYYCMQKNSMEILKCIPVEKCLRGEGAGSPNFARI